MNNIDKISFRLIYSIIIENCLTNVSKMKTEMICLH